MTQNALNQLKKMTTIVADSSDLAAIEKFRPLDATTNPSLITAAANQPENKELIEAAYEQAKQEGYTADILIERTIDILTVKFGVEILKLIEGRVSTEVDASLSYDTAATIAKAKELLALYKAYGIDQRKDILCCHVRIQHMSTLFFYHTERISKRQCASVRLQCPGRKTKHGNAGYAAAVNKKPCRESRQGIKAGK